VGGRAGVLGGGAGGISCGEGRREPLVEALDGNGHGVPQRGDEPLRLLRLQPRLAAQRQRQADDDALGLLR
jgi:hypothetical protein